MGKTAETWPKVALRKRPGGNDWRIDLGVIDGTRTQYFRKTEVEAVALADQYRQKRKRMGELAAKLSPEQTLEAAECFDALSGTNTTLRGLVAAFLSSRSQNQGERPVSTIRDALLADLEEAGRRPRTVTTLNQRLGLFVGAFGGLTAPQIRTSEISEWLSQQEWSLGTRIGIIRAIQQLFTYAVQRGDVGESPAASLILPKTEDKMPEIMEVEDVGRLLTHALAYHSFMVPELAIGFFAGLRSSEIGKLTWADLNFEEKIITVRPEVAKTRQARHVPMSENLVAWLQEACHDHSQDVRGGNTLCIRVPPIHDKAFAAHRRKLCKDLGIEWPANAMRHSYASYHYALHEDASKTAATLGHADTNMLFRNYRGLATKAQAEKYWGLRP